MFERRQKERRDLIQKRFSSIVQSWMVDASSAFAQAYEPPQTDVEKLTLINTLIQQSNPTSALRWQDLHY